MLSVDFRLHEMETGPGCWRFNPTLLEQPGFVQLLQLTVQGYFHKLDDHMLELNPQQCWDNLKKVLKETAIDYSSRCKHTAKKDLSMLQRRRQAIITKDPARTPKLICRVHE